MKHSTRPRACATCALVLAILAATCGSPTRPLPAQAADCRPAAHLDTGPQDLTTSWGARVALNVTFQIGQACTVRVVSLNLEDESGWVYTQPREAGAIVNSERLVGRVPGPSACQGLPHAGSGRWATFNAEPNAETFGGFVTVGVALQSDCPDKGHGMEEVWFSVYVDGSA